MLCGQTAQFGNVEESVLGCEEVQFGNVEESVLGCEEAQFGHVEESVLGCEEVQFGKRFLTFRRIVHSSSSSLVFRERRWYVLLPLGFKGLSCVNIYKQ
jgi:hypothetical protein